MSAPAISGRSIEEAILDCVQGLYLALTDALITIWGFFSKLGSEFWSAIAGAVVGGLIAYMVQLKALGEAAKERKASSTETQKGLAYSLLFKVISIDSSLDGLKQHVDQGLALKERERNAHISAVLKPLANLPTPVEFSADEMALLLSLKEDDVFNSIMSLDKIHNSIIPVWNLYASLRNAVTEMQQVDNFDPDIGRSEISIKPGSPLAIKIFETEMMAAELVRRAHIDAADASRALGSLIPLLNSKLNLGVGMTRKTKAA